MHEVVLEWGVMVAFALAAVVERAEQMPRNCRSGARSITRRISAARATSWLCMAPASGARREAEICIADLTGCIICVTSGYDRL